MTCYDCGAKVKTAIRQVREAKDRRFKAGFKDICEPCYEADMRRRAGRLLSQPQEASRQ